MTKKNPKKTQSYTLRPEHIHLVEWYAGQTNRSKSAVVDAILKEMVSAKESQAFFHIRLLERLRGMACLLYTSPSPRD